MHTISFVKPIYAESLEAKRQPQTLQPAGRRSVGKCLPSLLNQVEKQLFPKMRGAPSGGEGGRTERGRTPKCQLKLLLPLSSSAVTREEKAGGDSKATELS